MTESASFARPPSLASSPVLASQVQKIKEVRQRFAAAVTPPDKQRRFVQALPQPHHPDAKLEVLVVEASTLPMAIDRPPEPADFAPALENENAPATPRQRDFLILQAGPIVEPTATVPVDSSASVQVAFGQERIAKQIIVQCAKKHGITIGELVGQRRHIAIVRARHEAAYRLCMETRFSTPEIGKRLGGRDHTTILAAKRRHEQRLKAGEV